MAYWQKRWEFLNSIEYEFTYIGNYGAKGEKRRPRKKLTPEQVEKQNYINKKNKVRRLIKANFSPGDYWVTLKYSKGTRKPLEEIKKDMKKFTDNMRRAYKRQGAEFKYIYRVEIGRNGGIHIHIILNRSRGKPAADILLDRYWKGGHPYFAVLYEDGGYDQLASYLIKDLPEEKNEDEVDAYLKAYHPSRNLIRPEPEKKYYSRMTMRKLVTEGPVAQEGFYIDRDSVEIGENPFTGMSYARYTEIRLKPIRGDSS